MSKTKLFPPPPKPELPGDDLPTPEDQPAPIVTVTTTLLFFTLGQWRGMQTWQCAFCPWDTLEGEAAFWDHYRSRHAPPVLEMEPEI